MVSRCVLAVVVCSYRALSCCLPSLQAAHQQACDRESSLLEEKALLKTAVTAAVSQKEALEGTLGALQRDHTALVNESTNLRNQVCGMREDARRSIRVKRCLAYRLVVPLGR